MYGSAGIWLSAYRYRKRKRNFPYIFVQQKVTTPVEVCNTKYLLYGLARSRMTLHLGNPIAVLNLRIINYTGTAPVRICPPE